MAKLPPLISDQTAHVDPTSGKPSKEFYNWLKQISSLTTGFITADQTVALTNKTIADPSDILGGVKVQVGSDATGDMWYRNASGLFTRLPIGSAGQVLGVAGTPAIPTWQPAPTQALALLNTLTASNSASLQDTTSLTATYSRYLVTFDNIIPATNGVTFELQYQVSAAFQTTGYIGNLSQTAFIGLSSNINLANSAPGLSGSVTVNNPSAAAKIITSGVCDHKSSAANALTQYIAGGWWDTAGAVTGLKFLMSSGNITSGAIKIYGIA